MRVCPVCKKVGDSGDAVTQEQGFSIIDTHGSAIAISLHQFWFRYNRTRIVSYPHRNRIFVIGRHQEVRRFDSPGLHQIT